MSKDAKGLFEILVAEHSDMLWGYLRSTVYDQHAAEDIYQEAILVAWRRIDDFDRARSFGAWLRGIAGKLVLAHFRKSATRRPALVEEETLEALSHQFAALESHANDGDERLDALRDCLGGLSDEDQKIVKTYYHEKQGCQEIAETIALSVEAIKKRLQRSRAALAECIERKVSAKEVRYGI